ncbi:hypothetical protein F5146DRAFT_1164303 [Armillaria mellea]|nr:hypothetical protein F5146DRAFT_1164303 [Armillaria mellea]
MTRASSRKAPGSRGKANHRRTKAMTPIGNPAPLYRSLEERRELLKAEPFVDMDRTTETCIVCIRPGCDGKNVELDKRGPLQLSNWHKHCRKYHGNAIRVESNDRRAGSSSVGPADGPGPEKETIVALRLARTTAAKNMMTTRQKGLEAAVIWQLPDKGVLPPSLRRNYADWQQAKQHGPSCPVTLALAVVSLPKSSPRIPSKTENRGWDKLKQLSSAVPDSEVPVVLGPCECGISPFGRVPWEFSCFAAFADPLAVLFACRLFACCLFDYPRFSSCLSSPPEDPPSPIEASRSALLVP